MPAPLEIEVFWSFRSPWSYLATPRLAKWKEEYDLEVQFRPVYPIAIRSPEFFKAVNPLWTPYFMKDLIRVSQFLEIPIAWPSPDPVASRPTADVPDYSVAQPYIHRLTRLGVVAQERGRGIEFANQISTLIWGGTKGWHEGDHFARATERAGLDLEDLDATQEAESERLDAVIQQNQLDHEAAGHWGVPTCCFEGEPFFGQDRLDVLLWRLEQNGLKARGA